MAETDPDPAEATLYVCRECGNGFDDPTITDDCPDCGGSLTDTTLPHD